MTGAPAPLDPAVHQPSAARFVLEPMSRARFRQPVSRADCPNMAHLCRLARCTKVVSYLRYCGRAGRTAAIAVFGRVEMWRGGCRPDISVAASFVWRCLSGSTMTPFPHPAHRTGHADLPHPALGQDLTPLLSRATPSAVPEPVVEFIRCPISQVLHHVLRLS